ncbi:CAP64-like protein [Gymnopilus junonius]|uniref:CAP64-like protein n=1 Tax=Gymnopilus junonius TaxID=109634 RepID=A0A9P5NUP6_GYMJU|nr:CAP64-like protein [Gymnopilus junonius]
MASDSEKTRLHQRSLLGVTNRIWALLIVLVLVLSFTHFIWPSIGTSAPVVQNYSNADLKPKNYFNATEAGPNPFAFCPIYGPGDELEKKYGALTLSKSRLHLGSGARIQRVLNQALAGQPVTISVLGGSISACHGAGDDPISPKGYPSKFFQWWNSVFPHPASELTNGAMRRTNSGYFGFCNSHHLPDVTDLVIIELDTDDPPGEEMMENFEILIRSILIRPDQPAVLLLGHFSPQVHHAHGFAGPDHWHTVVAQFYDVPHISIKSAVYPDYMRDPNSIKQYYTDPILASVTGHDLITDILVAYMQSQICTAWSIAHGAAFDAVPMHTPEGGLGDSHGLFGGVGQRKGVPEPEDKEKDAVAEANRIKQENQIKEAAAAHRALMTVPPGRINTRPNSGRPYEEVAPFCVSANDLINPLPPSLFYGSGWFPYHPTTTGGAALLTTAHYWYSTLPTSKIRIPMQVGAGDIGIYYLKEPVAQVGEGSSVECWVDDNHGGAKLIENAAQVGEPTAALQIIDHYVSRGSHFVECQLTGEEGQGVPAFKIIGVFST